MSPRMQQGCGCCCTTPKLILSIRCTWRQSSSSGHQGQQHVGRQCPCHPTCCHLHACWPLPAHGATSTPLSCRRWHDIMCCCIPQTGLQMPSASMWASHHASASQQRAQSCWMRHGVRDTGSRCQAGGCRITQQVRGGGGRSPHSL